MTLLLFGGASHGLSTSFVYLSSSENWGLSSRDAVTDVCCMEDLLRFAVIDLNERGRFDEALALLDVHAGARFSTEALMQRGWALENCRRDREALLAYQSALALEPEALGALEGSANVLWRLGDVTVASECWRAVVRLGRERFARDPGDLELIGWSEHQLGCDQEAVLTFDEALCADPAAVSVVFDRALALACLGRIAESVAAFADALGRSSRLDRERRSACVRVASDDLSDALERGQLSLDEQEQRVIAALFADCTGLGVRLGSGVQGRGLPAMTAIGER